MKIDEYIKNIKLDNYKDYLLLDEKKKNYDFIEILNSNFINTQEFYKSEMNKFDNLYKNSNITNFYHLIKHIFLYKFIINNILYDNKNINNLFYLRIQFDLYDKDKLKEIIYSINNKSNESFSFGKNIRINKKKFLIKYNDINSFLNLLNNKYKISKKSSLNIYIYSYNGSVVKHKFKYIDNNLDYYKINIENKNNIKYIIKFNRIIFKTYDIHIKFDSNLIIYYTFNDFNNIFFSKNNMYCILNYNICKIKYVNNYDDLLIKNNIPNNISKFLICDYYIQNIDYNDWFKNNFNIKNMNEVIDNNHIIENNILFDSFISDNNIISKTNIRKIFIHFYLIYILLFINTILLIIIFLKNLI